MLKLLLLFMQIAVVPVTPFQQNCSVVWCEKTRQAAIVDPGGDLDQVLQVRHCPGHTPGHVIFFHEAGRFAIVGDVLFAGSIGRTDFPRGNHEQLLRSIRENLFPLGDDVTFLPGHGPTSTFGQERQTNPFVADSQFT